MTEKTDSQETTEEAKVESTPLSAFFGIKAGMSHIFTNEGIHIPVTVIKLIPNVITQVKTAEKDGYESYQVGYGEKREGLLNHPVRGILEKVNTDRNLTRFREIRVVEADLAHLGKDVDISGFVPETQIDVRGTSKGKGFQGVIKRHNFSRGPMAHGSKFHRTGGSIGNRATPGKVWKNKKMPGHMGAKTCMVQNLKVVEVNFKEGYMLIKGAVPGAKNSFVRISRAVKSS